MQDLKHLVNDINRSFFNLSDRNINQTINNPSTLATRRCKGVAQANG